MYLLLLLKYHLVSSFSYCPTFKIKSPHLELQNMSPAHLVSIKKGITPAERAGLTPPMTLPHLACHSLLELPPLTCTLWSFLVTCSCPIFFSVVYSGLLFYKKQLE